MLWTASSTSHPVPLSNDYGVRPSLLGQLGGGSWTAPNTSSSLSWSDSSWLAEKRRWSKRETPSFVAICMRFGGQIVAKAAWLVLVALAHPGCGTGAVLGRGDSSAGVIYSSFFVLLKSSAVSLIYLLCDLNATRPRLM